MRRYHLAIDIGASSGRHLLGSIENGKIACEEIHRFKNAMIHKNGALCWDIDSLFKEMLVGMKKCAEAGKFPESAGVDTWGVDFALIDSSGKIIGDSVAYRDSRTIGMESEVYKMVPEKELYARTGIAKQQFNTVFQLAALKISHPEVLEKAERLLFMPDFFHFLLSGAMSCEYTIASTSGLLEARKKDWDWEVIDRLGLPRKIFGSISMPGARIGAFSKEIAAEAGFSADITLPATHDTGSAYAAAPDMKGDSICISSGTWSLIGVCRSEPDCSEEARVCGFTNEGACDGKIRFLKNIMGLWMIQEISREFGGRHSYAALCEMAEAECIRSIVNCNDNRFLAPESMISEIKSACLEAGDEVPETPGQLAAVVYNSLADCYRKSALELDRLHGRKSDVIHVVGGGANAGYLNRLTAKYTGKTVIAGPVEATAIGNLAVQMAASSELENLNDAKELIVSSFDLLTYSPLD
ncbi:MAG: rhamnulokinase [Clostridiales bacterium]|jgi:rhamnulokinase|nr:rhamnulokinase [Clostridiales bacterium]